ncbi:MAG: hypothetical protein AAF078_06045, partial [Planctomycetota bacterium]
MAEPERMAAMSRRNVAESLRRFDWVHRWTELLGLVGMEPKPAAGGRVERLAGLAEAWDDGGASATADRPAAEIGA